MAAAVRVPASIAASCSRDIHGGLRESVGGEVMVASAARSGRAADQTARQHGDA